MLILARKVGESIIINEEICIEIVEIKGSKVRFGIRCPRSISIRRSELPALSEDKSIELTERDSQ